MRGLSRFWALDAISGSLYSGNMNLIPFSFILAGLLALPAAAGSSPAPALLHLDRVLTQTLQEKAQGQLVPERVAEFTAKFKADLGSAMAEAPQTPANTELHARILARLAEFDRAEAGGGAGPRWVDSRSGLSRAHFDEKTTLAVIAEEKRILRSEPFNESRAEPGSFSTVELSHRTRKIRFAAGDPDKLPAILPVKFAPAAAPPDFTGAPASKGSGPFPLLPLAAAAGLGAAAFGISKSKGAFASEKGLDDAHPVEPGPYQKLVAGTILAGAAGAVIYLVGAAVLTAAAPVVLRYGAPVMQQGMRLAASEAGSINPEEQKVVNEVPKVVARVIPYESGIEVPETIGLPPRARAFVTAARDIEGLDAAQIAQRLGIKPAPEYLVIRMPTPETGISTPILFDDAQFIGRGLTSGGAKEFYMSNGPIPSAATFEVVK